MFVGSHYVLTILTALIVLFNLPTCTRAVDHTGLLTKTLFTFQAHVCDNEKLQVRCPPGTRINIQWAQYGRQLPSSDLCPPWSIESDVMSKWFKEDTNCLAPTSLDIVLNECQNRRKCNIHASPDTFGDDPCPGTSKYLEVAYKCRPIEFRSRVACEGEEMLLDCPGSKRVAVYSAMFGRSGDRSMDSSNSKCPNPGARSGEVVCEAECAIAVVMHRCHGKRHCVISAAEEMFGNPCSLGTNKYLSVVFTCVSKRILKELKRSDKRARKGKTTPNSFCGSKGTLLTPSTPSQVINGGTGHLEPPSDGPIISQTELEGNQGNHNGGYNHNGHNGDTDPGVVVEGVQPGYVPKFSTKDFRSLTPSPTPPGEGKVTGLPSTTECVTEDPQVEKNQGGDPPYSFVTDWIYALHYIENNKEKFILYTLLFTCVAVIMVLLVIIFRLSLTRRKKKRQAKLDISDPIPNSPLPNGDNMTYVEPTPDRQDGIEMLSFNQSGTFHRPPPSFSTNQNGGTSTFNNPSRTSTFNRSMSNETPMAPQPAYRTNSEERTINNYYG